MKQSESIHSGSIRYFRNVFGKDVSAEAKAVLLDKTEKRSSSWYFADSDFVPVLEELRKKSSAADSGSGTYIFFFGKICLETGMPHLQREVCCCLQNQSRKNPMAVYPEILSSCP